jgi:hypothetical protein
MVTNDKEKKGKELEQKSIPLSSIGNAVDCFLVTLIQLFSLRQ